MYHWNYGCNAQGRLNVICDRLTSMISSSIMGGEHVTLCVLGNTWVNSFASVGNILSIQYWHKLDLSARFSHRHSSCCYNGDYLFFLPESVYV